MIVRDLMTKKFEFCTFEDTAAVAGNIMKAKNCGFIPIVRDKKSLILEGVLTDRDLALYLTSSNRLAKDVKLREFATTDLKTVKPGDNISQVKARMEEAHIHRVPVVDESGKLLGIISLKNLAEEAWKERAKDNPEFTEKGLAEIIESIALSR